MQGQGVSMRTYDTMVESERRELDQMRSDLQECKQLPRMWKSPMGRITNTIGI